MTSDPCGYLGCQNTTRGDYPWQMCDECYGAALDIEDSELDQ